MADVELHYRRDGLTYSGSIDAAQFTQLDYAEMMYRVHDVLQKQPEAGLVLRRLERPSLLPAQLEPELLRLLREDPAKYIEANTFVYAADLRPTRTSKLASKYIPPVGLRHGHDVMADALGDYVYLRLQCGRVESPYTGRFVPCADFCATIPEQQRSVLMESGWLRLATSYLLEHTEHSKFYLPRLWNPAAWITREDLSARYSEYLKEKEATNGIR